MKADQARPVPGAYSPYHRRPGACHRWSFLELGAYPTAPASARGHVGNVLREWGLKEFISDTEMVVSELVANSVQATRAISWPVIQPPVRLWLLSGGWHCESGTWHRERERPARVLVHVWDAAPEMPVARDAGPDDEGGRGLAIVAALSEAWSWYRTADSAGRRRGKVTWALIAMPSCTT
jgi:hypothetical protein